MQIILFCLPLLAIACVLALRARRVTCVRCGVRCPAGWLLGGVCLPCRQAALERFYAAAQARATPPPTPPARVPCATCATPWPPGWLWQATCPTCRAQAQRRRWAAPDDYAEVRALLERHGL